MKGRKLEFANLQTKTVWKYNDVCKKALMKKSAALVSVLHHLIYYSFPLKIFFLIKIKQKGFNYRLEFFQTKFKVIKLIRDGGGVGEAVVDKGRFQALKKDVLYLPHPPQKKPSRFK